MICCKETFFICRSLLIGTCTCIFLVSSIFRLSWCGDRFTGFSVWPWMSCCWVRTLIDWSVFSEKPLNLSFENVNDLAIYFKIFFRVWFIYQISETMFKLDNSLAFYRSMPHVSYLLSSNFHYRYQDICKLLLSEDGSEVSEHLWQIKDSYLI